MPTDRWIRLTTALAIAAAAAYLLYRLRFVLITVALAAMMAYALLPLVEWAVRQRVAGRPVSRLAATTTVFLLLVAVLAGGVLAATGPISGQFRRLAAHANQYQGEFALAASRVLDAVKRALPAELQQALDDTLTRASALVLGALSGIVRATAEWLAHALDLILVPILAFYFLVDLPGMKRELLLFLPPHLRPTVARAARRLDRILAAYVRGQLVLIAVATAVTWAGLALLGMRSALLLGLIAGITRAIPIIGPVLGAIPIVGLALAQSVPLGGAVLTFLAVLQIAESKLIVPRVMGRQLGLHAGTILIALLIGNALLGLMGMFLAAPVAAALKAGVDLIARPEPEEVQDVHMAALPVSR